MRNSEAQLVKKCPV